MLNLSELVRIYFCTQPTDMRKSFDSLAALVRDGLGLAWIGKLYAVEKDLRQRCQGEWETLTLTAPERVTVPALPAKTASSFAPRVWSVPPPWGLALQTAAVGLQTPSPPSPWPPRGSQ
jgi:hypothetical protein